MAWLWLEAALPLGIIADMLRIMGNVPFYIHKAAHGPVVSIIDFDLWQPKHIGNDVWDVAMERWDKGLLEKISASRN